MARDHRRHYMPRASQQGVSTLLIALMILAILSVVAFLAAQSGILEQRTSGSDYRYKLAFHAAEAGRNQGIQHLRVHTKVLNSGGPGGWIGAKWEPCSKATALGADPCLAEPDSARRAMLFRFVGTADGSLPIDQTFVTTGGTATAFPTTYKVYATLCRLETNVTSPATPSCSLSPTSSDNAFYVTLISVGQLTAESTTAVVKQSYGTFRSIGRAPDAPLIAAGTSIGLGNAQIVPNPNGGGFSVPVSIWAQGNATVDGASFATCHLGEWLANAGTPKPTAEQLAVGVCASCSCNSLCPGYGLLSGNALSCPMAKDKLEGEDVLDRDSNQSDASPKLVDHTYFPTDLFEYAFGVPSAMAVTYLEANATKIDTCTGLKADSAGLYWYTGGTQDCRLGDTVGSVENPVVLVSDKVVDMPSNGQFFGIIFVRSVAGSDELLKATGTPQVYGSVILEGGGKLGGTPTLIYNKAVLQNIFNSPAFLRFGPIPGSWSDDVTLGAAK